MEDIYKFVVEKEEFDKILSGKKTIHLVVNETKRKDYAIGNQITFCLNTENFSDDELKQVENGEILAQKNAEIVNLMYFDDIKEAIESLGRENCGFKPNAPVEKASDAFLAGESFESIEKHGIVAIFFKCE